MTFSQLSIYEQYDFFNFKNAFISNTGSHDKFESVPTISIFKNKT